MCWAGSALGRLPFVAGGVDLAASIALPAREPDGRKLSLTLASRTGRGWKLATRQFVFIEFWPLPKLLLAMLALLFGVALAPALALATIAAVFRISGVTPPLDFFHTTHRFTFTFLDVRVVFGNRDLLHAHLQRRVAGPLLLEECLSYFSSCTSLLHHRLGT